MLLSVTACSAASKKEPVPLVKHVDINRFMGSWYVIANIPTWVEEGAHNPVEVYTLKRNGDIDIDFTFRKNSFDGEKKHVKSTGFIYDDIHKSVWGVQFIWPIKADYRISYLDSAYTQTIISREKRDYVWVLARTPQISEEDYQAHLTRIEAMGYDISKVQRVPQNWDAASLTSQEDLP